MPKSKATRKSESECCCHDSNDGGCGCGCGCDCGCGSEGGLQRRYMTHKEELEMLEDYRGELKLELEAVEERIAELKSKKK